MFLFGPKINKLNVNEYKADYFKQKNHVLIDVRTKQEFKQGHVPGAINIPLDSINDRVDEIPTDKTVVVICATGNRSGMAVRGLTKAGYENVYNLQGGTMVWARSGYPIKR